jgi:hypothetical protein
MRYLRACVVLALLAGVVGAADPPEEKTGLKVGTKAPAFKLKDQAGKERSLDEFLKAGGPVVIVFHRSASW